ncbi:MAG: hypothetical protein H6718_06895 [Polyangiaceae bacterium]|nr:hypothetical protein [Myxococcales bacterium]MCB9585106.1 hypothetical protein [Polyangiaceae bacterium]
MLSSPRIRWSRIAPLIALLGVALLACKQSDSQNGSTAAAEQPQGAAQAPQAAATDDSEGWKCSAGMFSPCDCPDGSEGIHACDDNGNWGACDCTPAKPAKPAPKKVAAAACRDGQTRACPCGDGTFGQQTCDRGKWLSGCFMCD